MKNIFKTMVLLFGMAGALSACKGGVSGEKMDSTMRDTQSMDSSAKTEKKAGEMTQDTNSSNRSKVDTTQKSSSPQ